MKYQQRVFSLLQTFLGDYKKAFKVWDEWIAVKPRSFNPDLKELFTSNVREEFKAIVLTILMVPNGTFVPFTWQKSNHCHLPVSWISFKGFSSKIQHFAAELALACIEYANSKEGSADLQFRYNKLILIFLHDLPSNDPFAKKLFDAYQINDPVPYWGMDDASGYNPLYNIFTAKVSIHWKRLADNQMRRVIIAELQGGKTPREKHEAALRCYTDHIQTANYDGKSDYSEELLARQIHFLVNTPGIGDYNGKLFDDYQLVFILRKIEGEKYFNLRHLLARQAVLYNKDEHSQFSVWNDKSLEAATLMLDEFGSIDPDLKAAIETLLAAYEKKEQQQKEKENTTKQREIGILNEMM